MRIVFMGTPDFAVPSLQALIQSGRKPLAVVTQPDRPKGRGQRLFPPPVKVAAEAAGIPVNQPAKIKDPAFIEELKRMDLDLIVVVAFGRILPPSILEIPRLGCLNVHGSLLPKYRGAAPIPWAIIQGEKKTGVTTMRMNEGMDTGDIYLMEEVEIRPMDTAGILSARLAPIGAGLLLKTIEGIIAGTLKPVPQDHAQATMAPPLTKELGEVDWSHPAVRIGSLVRGLDPWPGAYTFYQDELWKLWGVVPRDAETAEPHGRILKVTKEAIEVATGRGVLEIRELQPESGKRMAARQFLAGHSVQEGVVLGG